MKVKLVWVILIGALMLGIGFWAGRRFEGLMLATTCLEVGGKWHPGGFCYGATKFSFD